jgi:hypothetical protein
MAHTPLIKYTWQKGDDFRKIAYKFTHNAFRYVEILDLNKDVLKANDYLMRPGDTILIPESWLQP